MGRDVPGQGWLARQPPEVQRAVLAKARPLALPAGQHVFHAGDAEGGVYGIVSGGVGVLVPGLGAALRLAGVIRAGVWFGHGPIMTGQARSLSFRAIEPSHVLHVPLPALRDIAASGPEPARAVGALSDFTIAIAIAAISDLLIPDSGRRLAAVLLRAAGVDMGRPAAAPAPLALRQAEIAEMANLSERMTGRLLKRFAAAGWILPGYGGLVVTDPPGLHGYAAGE